MQQYANNIIDANGKAQSGVTVRVLTLSGALATIYSDNGVTTTTNPLTTNSSGAFSFYAENGTYTLSVPGTAAGSYVTTLFDQRDLFTTPEIFGAVGDGTTDDLVALSSFVNAVNSNPGVVGMLGAKTYAISGSLPDVTTPGVRLVGAGPVSFHDVGIVGGSGSTRIKRITNSGGTMLQVAPIEGASAEALSGIAVTGIVFDCNSLAAKGLVAKSCRASTFEVLSLEATSAGVEFGVVSQLGEALDFTANRVRVFGRQLLNAAPCLLLSGSAAANVSFNEFEMSDFQHNDDVAVRSQNADNNTWRKIRCYNDPAGAATYCVEWQGGANSAQRTRSEFIDVLSAKLPPVAKGTGTYTVAATNIQIGKLDKENGTPDPVLETGASVYWTNDSTPRYDGSWTQTTPTPTAGAGTFTTVGATVRACRSSNKVDLQIVVTITTNGTAASYIRVPLPYTCGASAMACVLVGKELSAGAMLYGVIAAGTAYVDIATYAGSYPGGSGYTLALSGFMET